MRATPAPLARASERGFTLIELMVGLVIGLIAVLVMMQVFSVSEGFKRTTSGGSDAQVTGAITMAGFQREIRQAGHGLASTQILGCSVAMPAPAAWAVAQFAPFVINPAAIPAGDPNTDVIQIAFGAGDGPTEGDRIAAQPGVNTFAVATPTSFFVGDFVIAAPPLPQPVPCNLRLDQVNVAPAPPNVSVAVGTGGVSNGALYNLGTDPQVLVYAVRNGNLTQCNFRQSNCAAAGSVNDPNVWVPVGSDVVSLRAVYGRDTSAAVNGTGMVFDRTTPATACNWLRTTAAQIAVVTRSAVAERDLVSNVAVPLAWSGGAVVALDLSASSIPAGVDRNNFRYRVYETTVPLRNTTLVAGELGC